MAARGIAGIVAIILAVALAAFDVLYYTARHPRRGPVILVVCALLLIFGVILVVVGRRSGKAASGT
jgi:hypothetical protein